MIIDLSDQMKISAGLPPKRAEVFVNSSLPIALLGIPEKREDGEITAVAVTVTNADAMPTTAPCVKEGAAWRVAFAPSCFPTYGFVERGYKVVATVKTPTGGTMSTTLAVGDVEIKADTPTATPGDPEKSYQIKGEDIFAKTRVIDGVQHYARQEISYDAEMGAWGADWLGDYILVDGEFVPFQAAGGTAATVATALLALLLVPFSAFGITATKEYVDRKDGEVAALSTNTVTTATNAVLDAARGYTDTAISQIPPPDFSTSNTALVETIKATAPAPGNYATVSNAAVHAAITNALQDVAIESNRVNIASNRVAISTLSDSKLDLAGGTVTGQIYFDAQGYYGYLGLAYDGENKRLLITDGWNENIAYLEVPWAYDGDRVAFTRDIDFAISGKQDNLPYPTNSIPYAAISGKPTLATVATSGSYNDLSNKPTIPTVPTNVSAFNNDAGYLTGYTESDPTIKSWAKANTKPTYTASEVGATTAEDVYRIVAGTNVLLIVTNYNSAVHAPLMSLQHLDPDTGEYVVYWNESRRHGITLTNAMEHADAAVAAERARADAAYAPRAWSHTTSGLGAEAPSGVTWISTPETVIAGGYEYEKVVTSAGAVWVLASNGLTAGATTNGYFRIEASDGTELFSIEKTDSYLVGVPADGITRSGNTVTIPLNVVAPSHPYIRAATNIVNAVWTKEDENGFACDFASVSWSGSSGAYVATVTCAEPQAFFYFEFLHEGTSKIRNSAATEMTGGIYFNGTTYMPTVNGNKLEFVAQ